MIFKVFAELSLFLSYGFLDLKYRSILLLDLSKLLLCTPYVKSLITQWEVLFRPQEVCILSYRGAIDNSWVLADWYAYTGLVFAVVGATI